LIVRNDLADVGFQLGHRDVAQLQREVRICRLKVKCQEEGRQENKRDDGLNLPSDANEELIFASRVTQSNYGRKCRWVKTPNRSSSAFFIRNDRMRNSI
jgi:hypothetical protein